MATVAPSAATTSSWEDRDHYQSFAHWSQLVTALALYPIVCLLGAAGSCLSIAVFSRRQMRNSTNAFLTALALADLSKLLNDFLYFPATLAGRHGGGDFAARIYPGAYFLSQYSAGCAAWLTVAVATERWLMVTQPGWSRSGLTVRKARLTALAVFLAVLAATAPHLLRYEAVCRQDEPTVGDVDDATQAVTVDYVADNNCTSLHAAPSRLWRSFGSHAQLYVRCHSCLRSLVPLLLLAGLNTHIALTLRVSRANRRKPPAARGRATRALVAVILCAIVLTTPDSILSALGWGYTEAGTSLRRGVREISDLLLTVNSAANFFLYAAFNSAFRRNLVAVCAGRGQQWHRRHRTALGQLARSARVLAPPAQQPPPLSMQLPAAPPPLPTPPPPQQLQPASRVEDLASTDEQLCLRVVAPLLHRSSSQLSLPPNVQLH